ncbi:MAG: DUF370 domain-containing protein [Oscillospiraceae bacterium]|nr:DUF370 domain-containing protein [Oscillospiraceae bacterium]MBQ7284344.1 DUF370 domain-containing protein [Oscillospiraceae bacterium]MBQ7816259.1 DUF370 domain-containing protein [Oscillospiraceae bacterium]
MGMMNIGFGSMINPDRIVAALSPESAPVKRMITKAKSENTLIDATFGRKTKTVIITDNNQIILCAFSAERIFGQASDTLIKFMETEDE